MRHETLRLATALFVAALLAGCTIPAAAPERATPAQAPAQARAAPAADEWLVPVPLTLDAQGRALDLEVSERWARPMRPLFAHLPEAPPEGEVVWLVALEGADLRVRLVDGHPYVAAWTTGRGHHHHGPADAHEDEHAPGETPEVPARPRAQGGALEPGPAPLAVRLPASGAYVLGLADEGPTLRVVARPDAVPLPGDVGAYAVLVEEQGERRFVPSELEVRPGERVLLYSRLAEAVAVEEQAFLALLPGRGPRLDFTPVEEGVHTLVALVRLPTMHVGHAEQSFLVDFERPATRHAIGPATGGFALAEAEGATGDSGRRLPFKAPYPIARLSLWFNATSDLPAPASVRIVVEREGEVVAEASTLQTGVLELADLPEGAYAVRILPEHGAMVAYEVGGEMTLRLPLPDRLAAQEG